MMIVGTRRGFVGILALLFFFPAVMQAQNEESQAEDPTHVDGVAEESARTAASASTARGKSASPGPKSRFPAVAKVTAGYEALSGFYKLYVDKKKNRVLAEIPRREFGKKFMLATSIVGGLYTGWQWDSLMVQWEEFDGKLVLVEPEIRYVAKGTLSDVVRRTYRDRVVASLPIVAQGRGTVVVDFTRLFGGRAGLFVGPLASGADASLTKVAKAKAFPHNVELELDLMKPRRGGGGMLFGFGGGGGGGSLGVHYSLSRLPNTGYQPRAADDRIGYFLTALKDFSKDSRDESRFVRLINRWHVEKADPSLKLSPPKEPIVFYIEKTVPIRYRRYVRDGILEWNKAFEKIGISPAIDVRQQTASAFNDLDPEDVRYNFFRWITSEMSFAMGPSRVHPETGQILDADIIFDDSMIRSWLGNYAVLIEQGPQREYRPALKQYLKDFPERHPMRRWRGRRHPVTSGGGVATPANADTLVGASSPEDCGFDLTPAQLMGHGRSNCEPALCSFGPGMRHQVNLGLLIHEWQAGEKKGDDWPEEFLGQVLKEVVMHEVGHTLGLRHNFKASSWLSLEEIKKGESEATSGSVMDYNPILVGPDLGTEGHWITQTIGPYDYWAIEYGYTLDKKKLSEIGSRVAAEGLAYGTDEDRWSSDPRVNVFDMGKDPLKYAQNRLKLIRRMLGSVVERVVKPGDSYQVARRAFDMLLFDYSRTAWYASRFVGGHHVHRDHKGDPGERQPIEPVAAHKQREALAFVCEQVFSKDAFQFNPELLNFLAVGRWMHWGSRDPYSAVEYPIHDRVLMLQSWALFDFLNPFTLGLIYDAETRVSADEDALTIPELLQELVTAIYGEVREAPSGTFTNRKPFINSIRRNLQHEFVEEMIELALEDKFGRSPQAARTQAWYRLRELGKDIGKLLKAEAGGGDFKLDDYSRAHLIEAGERIGKALEASYSRGGSSMGMGGLFLIGREAEAPKRE